MKWKTVCCLIFAAAVITAAFYLPQVLLHHQQENMMSRVETRPVEQLSVNLYQQSNLEKLSIISSPTASSTYMNYEVDNQEEILDMLNQELKTLRNLGICKTLLDFGDVVPRQICNIIPIMYMDHQEILQVYDVDTVWGMFTLDAKTGKILKMEPMSKYQEDEVGEVLSQWLQTGESYTQEFALWAEYYGLTPTMVEKGWGEPWDAEDSYLLLYGSLSDDLGQQVGMMFTYYKSMYKFQIASQSMDMIEEIQLVIGEYPEEETSG